MATTTIMESKEKQPPPFPFDMGLDLHEHTTFLDPSPTYDIPFKLDFLSPSSSSTDHTQQQDLLAQSMPCLPFEQYSPLLQGDDDSSISREQPEISHCSPSFLISHLDINQSEQQQHPTQSQKEQEEPIECYNCKVVSTPLWRRTPDRAHILCNACGLYYKQYKCHRPVRIWQRATRWLGVEGYNQSQYTHPMQQQQQRQQQCANCHQTDTPLWRKNSRGQSICNACGLFFKLHHRDRPVELNKTNSQRRRRRRQEPLDGTRDMFMGLRANMPRDEMQLVLRIMEERCAFLKAMLGNMPRNSSNESSQQQEENFGYM